MYTTYIHGLQFVCVELTGKAYNVAAACFYARDRDNHISVHIMTRCSTLDSFHERMLILCSALNINYLKKKYFFWHFFIFFLFCDFSDYKSRAHSFQMSYLHSSWNGSNTRKSRQVGGYEFRRKLPHFLHGSLNSFR